jgi:hypothetical protein
MSETICEACGWSGPESACVLAPSGVVLCPACCQAIDCDHTAEEAEQAHRRAMPYDFGGEG